MPSLFVFSDLRRTIMEFEGYMWDEETQKPMKKDDHMMENLYRLCLWDTQYIPLEDEVYGDEHKLVRGYGRDIITGY